MKQTLLLLSALPHLAFGQAATGSIQPPAFFAKQGIKVLSHQRGAGGLNVWQVSRGATKTVLYTTPDNKVLLSAVLWDAATGSNLSDAYITADMKVEPGETLAAPAAVISDVYSPAKPSEAIKGIASLVGIKEGRAVIDKTLYIIFDPRCKYCHNVYQKTRDFVKGGGAITWIPTTVLGDRAGGARLVADVLQAKNPAAALKDVMAGGKAGQSNPSAATAKAINQNEAYFFAAFERNKNAGAAGVPVAFFESKDGAPQMVAGIDDDVLLKRIFSDIKK